MRRPFTTFCRPRPAVVLGTFALVASACSSSRPADSADIAGDTLTAAPELAAETAAETTVAETTLAETSGPETSVEPDRVFCPKEVDDVFGLGEVTVSTSTTASSNDLQTACVDTGDAPDMSFLFRADQAGLYTFTMRGATFDAVLVMRHDCGTQIAACDHRPKGDGAATITTMLAAHETVVLTVDGVGGASGDFALAFVPGAIGEDCTNGIDDDGDGAIDCKDGYDCRDAPGCIERDCHDGQDNDRDGLTDCADEDCVWTEGCGEKNCSDGLDDDGDGLVDCASRSCASARSCAENCTDGVDDNHNGAIDCADFVCADDPACAEKDCVDGVDNDGDGDVDCSDADCWDAATCLEADCRDGLDNDGDLRVDCQDPDCGGDPACQ